MWGTSVRLGANKIGVGQQLTKIDYKRPDTWSFWFGASIVSGVVNANVDDQLVGVHIDIMTGVGRSMFLTEQRGQIPGAPPDPLAYLTLNSFCSFQWVIPPGTIAGRQLQNFKYTTQVQTPLTDDDDANSAKLVEWIPASNINVQCSAVTVQRSGDPANPVEVEVHAYFAPRSHVRPDWFQDDSELQYLGEETGGS